MYRLGFLKVILTTLLPVLAGCSSGNRAQPIDLPENALENATKEASSDPFMEVSDSKIIDWWSLFEDEQLTAFIQQAFAWNPTLKEAYTRILLAASNADKARSVLYPTINWAGDILREKFSQTGIIPFASTGATGPGVPFPATGGVNGIPVYFTQYETELLLNYDFDFWNKNRNMLRAAIGEIYSNIAEEAFARLELGIAVAQVYFQLQIDYKRQEIANALVENQNEYLDLNQQRLSQNIDNKQVVHTGSFNVAAFQQVLLAIQGDIAVKENQLRAYLAGDFQDEIKPIQIAEKPLLKVVLPIDLPLHLISQRPDITAQLWLIESAGRLIESAKAGFYPDFNISALFGYQTIHLHELFQWPSTYFNVDPAFTLPIFDGGRLLANLRQSEVNYDLAIYEYNNLVLQAVQEVLDGIAVLRNAGQQLQEFNKKLDYQEKIFELMKLRVNNNINSKLDYLTSEQNVLNARDQTMVALGNTLQAMLQLIKALGGGYMDCEE